MREVPADLALEPMPEGFTCNIADDPRGLMKTTVTINGSKYEVGVRDMGTADGVQYLKQSLWQIQELIRVGRDDLCQYASVGRHTHR